MQLFGAKGQSVISSSWAALINFTPVHAELAKNLALLGFSLLLVDSQPLTASDIQSNLFFNAPEQSLEGIPRIEIASKMLRDMNPFIQVKVAKTFPEAATDLLSCSLFLICPNSFAEFDDIRKALDPFKGSKVYSFCGFGTGLTFVERRTDATTSPVSLLDETDYSNSFDRIPLIHKFCTQNHSRQLFDYNQNENDWFIFSGVYGSLLSQLVLDCVLEIELEFNTLYYDVFGSDDHCLDSCTCQALKL